MNITSSTYLFLHMQAPKQETKIKRRGHEICFENVTESLKSWFYIPLAYDFFFCDKMLQTLRSPLVHTYLLHDP